MDQDPCSVPGAPECGPQVKRRGWLTIGDVCELTLLSAYVAADVRRLWHLFAVDWPALWRRYGDTDAYWNTVFAHMRECQLMIVQPVGVLALWLICVAIFRGRFRWTTALAILTIIIIECVNYSWCYYDAFGVGC
jgi:hypothetical protein